jgi:hypothetical protein
MWVRRWVLSWPLQRTAMLERMKAEEKVRNMVDTMYVGCAGSDLAGYVKSEKSNFRKVETKKDDGSLLAFSCIRL